MKRKYVALKTSKEQLKIGKIAETDNSWKSYTCFLADYLKKKRSVCFIQ